MTRPLTNDERAILEALLAEPFPGHEELKAQVSFVRAEETSESNEVQLAVERSKVPPAAVIEAAPTGGYGYNGERLLMGVVLCVAEGYLDALRYWSPSDAQTLGPVRPETFQLGGWSPRDEEDGFRHMSVEFLDVEMPEQEPDEPHR
jgi:hypothetical protein